MRFSVRKSRNNTHSAEDSYAELRNKMVRKQIRNRGIANPTRVGGDEEGASPPGLLNRHF